MFVFATRNKYFSFAKVQRALVVFFFLGDRNRICQETKSINMSIRRFCKEFNIFYCMQRTLFSKTEKHVNISFVYSFPPFRVHWNPPGREIGFCIWLDVKFDVLPM